MRSGRRELVVAVLAVAGLSVAADTRPSRYRVAPDAAGAYGSPVAEAAPVALGTVAQHLLKAKNPSVVRFVLFDDEMFDGYHHAMHHLGFDHGH